MAADRIGVQDRADRVIVSGDVRVTQAGMTLTAQRMTIAYTRAGGTDINRLDASGGVTVTKGNEVAKGNVAIYDLNRRLITMVGHVELRKGANRLSGGRMSLGLNSGRATVAGRAAARRPHRHMLVGENGAPDTGDTTAPPR